VPAHRRNAATRVGAQAQAKRRTSPHNGHCRPIGGDVDISESSRRMPAVPLCGMCGGFACAWAPTAWQRCDGAPHLIYNLGGFQPIVPGRGRGLFGHLTGGPRRKVTAASLASAVGGVSGLLMVSSDCASSVSSGDSAEARLIPAATSRVRVAYPGEGSRRRGTPSLRRAQWVSAVSAGLCVCRASCRQRRRTAGVVTMAASVWHFPSDAHDGRSGWVGTPGLPAKRIRTVQVNFPQGRGTVFDSIGTVRVHMAEDSSSCSESSRSSAIVTDDRPLARLMNAVGACSHCLLPIGRIGLQREVNGEAHQFCCYGCCLAYQVHHGEADEPEAAALLIRLGVGAFLAMSIMLFSLLLYSGTFGEADAGWCIEFTGCYGLWPHADCHMGGPFIAGAWQAARRLRVSADTLVSIGALAAYGYSVPGRARVRHRLFRHRDHGADPLYAGALPGSAGPRKGHAKPGAHACCRTRQRQSCRRRYRCDKTGPHRAAGNHLRISPASA